MQPLDQNDIRRALVNLTKSERASVTFSPDFAAIPWDRLDSYGWCDPKFPATGIPGPRLRG
ncbi:FBP domain-containing protein [uncultured Jatrophihabitans sp.]|uniref:FBP domain-containing protein n=1 Tax=uncultured Jatrophihabitans sp. TaxID=1610747 RepID=UPI0035C97591